MSRSPIVVCLVLAAACSGAGPEPAPAPPASPATPAASTPTTQVVLLGTGTPNADPDRWGPAVAVVVDGESYLVDAGPGIVRRAAAAARDRNIPALRAANLRRVFLTHLHSDHTLGLPDLMFSPWVLERTTPLDVFGPAGTRAMTEKLEEAFREDIDMRLNGGEPQTTRNYRAVVKEITSGLVYEDARVRVDAFAVPHGSWKQAFAFRFKTADRTVVISGDTGPTPALVDACNGCDVLMYEVYSAERFQQRPPAWQRYHSSFHTSTKELAALAERAKPKLLVLYHQLFWGATDADLEREVRAAGYTGRVVSGRDLEVY
jgi:ribonuclease BN (tRNA processing enzyme)